jgi:hypothetical protein
MSTGLTQHDRNTIDAYCAHHGLGRRAQRTLTRQIARSHASAAAVLDARATTREIQAAAAAERRGTIRIEGSVRGLLYADTDPVEAARILRQDIADCASLPGGAYSDACPDLDDATAEQCMAFHEAMQG